MMTDLIKDTVKRYTIADLEMMPDDGTRRELIEGELIEMPGAKPDHNLIATLLAAFLTMYTLPRKSGIVMTEMGCQLSINPDTKLFPDVGYVSAGRLGSHNLHEYFPFAPDLAVEIISPSNTAEEMDSKIDWYFRSGTRLIWIVYIHSQKVYVYTLNRQVVILDRQTVLDGDDVLPGFSLKLADLFEAVSQNYQL